MLLTTHEVTKWTRNSMRRLSNERAEILKFLTPAVHDSCCLLKMNPFGMFVYPYLLGGSSHLVSS